MHRVIKAFPPVIFIMNGSMVTEIPFVFFELVTEVGDVVSDSNSLGVVVVGGFVLREKKEGRVRKMTRFSDNGDNSIIIIIIDNNNRNNNNCK